MKFDLHFFLRVLGLASVSILAGCGSSDDGGSANGGDEGFGCDSLPACYTEALAGFRKCASDDSLLLAPVAVNSNVAQGVSCSGSDLDVTFADFSGTPNKVTINQGGMRCGDIQTSEGKKTADGETTPYEFTKFTFDGESYAVRVYEDDTIGVLCGVEEVSGPADALDSCANDLALVSFRVTGSVRDDDISGLSVEILGLTGESSPFLVCE